MAYKMVMVQNQRPPLFPLSLTHVSVSCLHLSVPQEAAYHPEVSKDVQMRALRYGNECATGYLGLLEHVLVVRPHTHSAISKERPVCSSVSLYAAA